jgi:hypothetical protein
MVIAPKIHQARRRFRSSCPWRGELPACGETWGRRGRTSLVRRLRCAPLQRGEPDRTGRQQGVDPARSARRGSAGVPRESSPQTAGASSVNLSLPTVARSAAAAMCRRAR